MSQRYEKAIKKDLKYRCHICSHCGYLSGPVHRQRGAWEKYFLHLLLILPILVIVSALTVVEILLRLVTFHVPKNAIWDATVAHLFPHTPTYLKGCVKCGCRNTMCQLKSREGKMLFERFEKDNVLRGIIK